MLFGMDDLIGETTGIQTTAVDDPISAVAIGTGRYTEFIEGKQTRADDRREWMANQMPQQTAVSGSLFLVKLGY